MAEGWIAAHLLPLHAPPPANTVCISTSKVPTPRSFPRERARFTGLCTCGGAPA